MNKFNYCIIGSGIGGSVLAKKLAQENPNKSIILIEAGNKKNNGNTNVENVGLPFGLRATTAIQLGGTTNLWHGVLSKLDSIDFEKREWIPNSGWPISLNDLEPFYKESADIFGVKEYDYFQPKKLPKKFKEKFNDILFNKKILKNKLFQQPLPTVRLKDVISITQEECENFTILMNATALEIFFDKSNKKATSILIGEKNGETKKIEFENLIICAGALQTPRLLLNSKMKNKNIGKYLMDHPMGNLCQLAFKTPQKAHLYSDMKYHPKNKIKTGLIFNEETQFKNKLLNHNFYLRPSFKRGINDESEKIKLAFLTFLSGKIKFKDVMSLLKNPNIILQILAYKFTLNLTYKFTDLFFVTEQVPNKNSTVTLSENIVDQWNYPISCVNWQLTNQDLDSMTETFNLIHEKGFYKEDFEFVHKSTDIKWHEIFTSAAHHVGTARMSKDTSTGVVDENLKVHNLENIYICDGSVFTTSGNVNSGLTIGALACRLASHLNSIHK